MTPGWCERGSEEDGCTAEASELLERSQRLGCGDAMDAVVTCALVTAPSLAPGRQDGFEASARAAWAATCRPEWQEVDACFARSAEGR